MNTKILVSLLVIGLTAAAIGGSMTGAFFSDTETSQGNTFTAGEIDLLIDSTCTYNGDPKEECSWELTDLEAQKFFNYADLKPGDYGENTISIHVDTNPAWGCVVLTKTSDDENGCNEPEIDDEPTCESDTDGELGANLNFMIWADICDDEDDAVPGDNIYQVECDELLTAGTADAISTVKWTLADAAENNVGGIDGEPLDPTKTYFIGAAWCLGTIEGDGYCNGLPIDNSVQTDSYTADISFEVVQARNNGKFLCNPVD
ncbi:MAG: hypothetical protein JW727_01235 [Candidatus Aenigmarchaeota archaeon]|nr:hypothetical protein [Candidatus Aenigmarchaeota archaeon]